MHSNEPVVVFVPDLAGAQGPPGPPQIVVGGDPTPIPGYPILLLKDAGGGDYVPVIRTSP